MGQIANDFKEWVIENKSHHLRPDGGEPYLPFNVSQMSEVVEEFLIWKTQSIRNTQKEVINTIHNNDAIKTKYTKEEIKLLMKLIYNKSNNQF